MPFAGNRTFNRTTIDGRDQYVYFWSSSPYNSDQPKYARSFRIDSSYGGATNYMNRANTSVVRCFSNDYMFSSPSMNIVPNG